MFGKAFLGIGAAVAIGAYFNGAFSGSYARTVGASPDEVRSALEDLDIREAPGEPVHVVEQVEGVRHAHHPAQREDGVDRHRVQPV